MNSKLIILDRDGTINHDSDDYVKSPDEWQALPGAIDAIARLNHAGWHTVIVTNQSGLGRGLFDVATCLGSINFGSIDVISKQIAKVVSCLKPKSRVYWRLNPGRQDHPNRFCENIDYFPWTLEIHNLLLTNMVISKPLAKKRATRIARVCDSTQNGTDKKTHPIDNHRSSGIGQSSVQ